MIDGNSYRPTDISKTMALDMSMQGHKQLFNNYGYSCLQNHHTPTFVAGETKTSRSVSFKLTSDTPAPKFMPCIINISDFIDI